MFGGYRRLDVGSRLLRQAKQLPHEVLRSAIVAEPLREVVLPEGLLPEDLLRQVALRRSVLAVPFVRQEVLREGELLREELLRSGEVLRQEGPLLQESLP